MTTLGDILLFERNYHQTRISLIDQLGCYMEFFLSCKKEDEQFWKDCISASLKLLEFSDGRTQVFLTELSLVKNHTGVSFG